MKILLSAVLLLVAVPVIGEGVSAPSSNAVQLARLYHEGRTNEFFRLYRDVAESHEQNDPDVMFVVARFYLDQSRKEEAFRMLKKISRARPSDYLSLFVMGVEMTKLGDRENAADVLRESVKRNPSHGPSYLWLAKASISRQESVASLRYVLVLEDRTSPAAKEAIRMLEELERDAQPSVRK